MESLAIPTLLFKIFTNASCFSIEIFIHKNLGKKYLNPSRGFLGFILILFIHIALSKDDDEEISFLVFHLGLYLLFYFCRLIRVYFKKKKPHSMSCGDSIFFSNQGKNDYLYKEPILLVCIGGVISIIGMSDGIAWFFFLSSTSLYMRNWGAFKEERSREKRRSDLELEHKQSQGNESGISREKHYSQGFIPKFK